MPALSYDRFGPVGRQTRKAILGGFAGLAVLCDTFCPGSVPGRPEPKAGPHANE